MSLVHPVWATPLNSTVLIEASAGTGKTWTLTGLYLRALTEQKLSVEQIAVVTFTNSAAAELKQRILLRIEEAHNLLAGQNAKQKTKVEDPFFVQWLVKVGALSSTEQDQLLTRLKIAKASADQMRVSTIHSFCQRLLMMGFGKSVLFSRSELVNSTYGLFKQVRDEYFTQQIQDPNFGEVFAQWLAEGGDQLERGQDKKNGLLDQRRLQDALRHPLANAVNDQADIALLLSALQSARQDLRELSAEQLIDWVETINSHAKVSRASFNTNMRENVKTNWPSMLQGPRLLLNESATIDMFARLCWQHEKLGLSNEPEPTNVCAVASKNYLLALNGVTSLIGVIGYNFRNFALQRLEALKRERGIALPDDLIYLLRESLLSVDESSLALVDEALERFPLALVDETQDTDSATWEVLFRLYEKKGGLVAVGDPKQTIYRFRGADVFEYLSAKERCAERLTLQENFRSHALLLQAFNQLFSAPKVFELDGIEFQNALPSTRRVEQLIENDQVLSAFQISAYTEQSVSNKIQSESLALNWTVQQVQRFLLCALGEKPVRPGNIAILVDSHAQAKKVRRALNAVGIAAAENAKQWVTTTDEADELLVILDAMANPKNKSLVYRALATRLLQHSDNELAQLRDDPQAWHQCLDQWLRFNQVWQQQGCYAALSMFFEYWKTAPRLMRLQSGERRWANLVHLIEMMALQAHQCTSPLEARQWLAATRQVDESEADNEQLLLRLETDQALVSITTIHSSKGLEYDIVLLPFLSDGKKCDLSKEWPYLSHTVGSGGEHATELRFETPVQEPFATRCEIEVQAEAARKLYVALTRAKSCCAVFLYNSAATIKYSSWHRLMARHLQAYSVEQVEAQQNPPTVTLADASLADVMFDFSAQLARLSEWQSAEPEVFSVNVWQPIIAIEPNVVPMAKTINYPPPVFARQLANAAWVRRPAWATTSFSSLAHQHEKISASPSVEEVWLKDHDANVLEAVPTTSLLSVVAEQTDDSIRWRFPRGEVPGQYLHRAFELHNFQERFSAVTLQKLGLEFDLQTDFEQTAQWLNEILDTSFVGPAATSIVLRNLVNTARKTELEFNMQVAPTLQLRGFIDLVFQWQGKAYILDWKSNWLGVGPQAYQPHALQNAMQTNQYDLQARIYALAVHRWLEQRLGAQYQYDQHFGGVVYLFLRGVGLDPAAGVHCWRPTEQEILKMQKQGPI